MRKIADKHHEQAAERNVKIVTSCGVEAVAADLPAFLICKYMRDRLNRWAGVGSCVARQAGG